MKKVPVYEDDGKTPKKVKGVPQYEEKSETEKVEHTFETHEHELVGSAATRYAKEKGMPKPPPGLSPTLGIFENGLVAPTKTIKAALKLGPKFTLAGWDTKRS